MAPRKPSPPPSCYPIGNCQVIIEGPARNYTCEVEPSCLKISASKSSRIQISVREYTEAKGEENSSSLLDCQFVLVNHKDADSCSKSLTHEVLSIYTKELPQMSYAANTGKKSAFLERCVSNGKYRALVLRSNNTQGVGEVLAAISYQIIPADSQYAEIPLAAVSSIYQRKGIGKLLYMELRKRLQAVGVKTILCWGDKESECFWQKQGFISVAEVDSKGKAHKFSLKSDVRRALCFPGDSVLMMSNVSTSHELPENVIKLNICNSNEKPIPATTLDQSFVAHGENTGAVVSQDNFHLGELHLQPEYHCEQLRTDIQYTERIQRQQIERGQSREMCCPEVGSVKSTEQLVLKDTVMVIDSPESIPQYYPYTCEQKAKRTACEPSLSSLRSKRVKASSQSGKKDESYHHGSNLCCKSASSISEAELVCPLTTCYIPKNYEECFAVNPTSEALSGMVYHKKDKPFIMLMDIADGPKKTHLIKVIEDLGGNVTTDGGLTTHVLTGKVRRTLNFCTALCSGAWILSPNWLKASFREGIFVDVVPYILEDEDYRKKYKIDIKEAVVRAKERPGGLLEGYQICVTTHIQPPVQTLSAIVRSAGGNVVRALDDINDDLEAIFVACEEDMEEALLASKRGIKTFNSDWFMSCIMKQELDLDAPQFAESL